MEIDRRKNFRLSEWAQGSGTPDSGDTDSEGTETPILGICSSELHNDLFSEVMKTYSKNKQCGILLQLLQQKYRSPELESQLEGPWLRDCTKFSFSTAYHPQIDGLAERMIQTMEDIIRRFFACGMEYKGHEGYTHDWVTLLPAVQLAYNTTKDFHYMWKRACDTAAKCIAEAKEYNKQRWDKSHMEPYFKEGDQVLVSTPNFNNLKGPEKIRDSFLGPFTIIKLIGKNALDVKLTEEFSRKHPLFPVSLVKPYFQTEEDKFPSRKKNPTPPEIVEVEDSPVLVKKIIKARKIRLNVKDQRKYLVGFKTRK
ncbi:hypothetical protein O181_018651 [Austropuccinia psidii MF-1]|uniref:Tf2-1-like SH3-like domain-containing protein n=1 Tax=Austropuccinia psidii MF-1 TaxID=1389203 RepID=A0A9Q3C5Q1_9BASI|nr:hypothetical protein [Austropuccinia psidii MF-1]